MILYPAIDIRGGQTVRLVQGDYEREKVYDADPVDAALRWAKQGARRLHVVDLDGARQGKPANLETVRRIVETVDVPVQLGGGLRSLPDVRAALAIGVQRVILGTAAVKDPPMLESVLEADAHRVLVSLDARDGRVVTSGWTETTEIVAEQAIERLQRHGVRNFVFTNVGLDGTLEGPDLGQVQRIAATVQGHFTCSGGIGSLDDLRALVGLRCVNLTGVIVGKALYEERFTVADGQAVLLS